MLLIPKGKVDDFIEELVDGILEDVIPESEIIHMRGEIFERTEELLTIPEFELRATIREVIERWLNEEG
jgi:hypothetical protein